MGIEFSVCAKSALIRMSEIAISANLNKIDCRIMLLALFKESSEIQRIITNQNDSEYWSEMMDCLENKIAEGKNLRKRLVKNLRPNFDEEAKNVIKISTRFVVNDSIKALNIFCALISGENSAVDFLRSCGIAIPAIKEISIN